MSCLRIMFVIYEEIPQGVDGVVKFEICEKVLMDFRCFAERRV
jgi:hypothetical protein